jgi:hypothetical protein
LSMHRLFSPCHQSLNNTVAAVVCTAFTLQ